MDDEDWYVGVKLRVDRNGETLRTQVHRNGFFDRRVGELRRMLEATAFFLRFQATGPRRIARSAGQAGVGWRSIDHMKAGLRTRGERAVAVKLHRPFTISERSSP